MVAHAGPYRSRSCASPDGHRLDNFNSDIWYQHVDPDDTCSRQGHMDRAEGAPAHRIRRKVFGADLPGRQGRLSRSPQSLERIERFYDGRQAEPLLLDPGLHSAPLSRSLTLRERAKLTGLARSGDMETPVSLPGRLINGRTGALFVTSAR